MAMLATMRGIPQIFSGDEMMFTSKDLSQGHGGLRVDFPGGWEGDAVNLFDPAQRDAVQAGLFDYTQRLFQWRKSKPVIHNGRTMHFLSQPARHRRRSSRPTAASAWNSAWRMEAAPPIRSITRSAP